MHDQIFLVHDKEMKLSTNITNLICRHHRTSHNKSMMELD